MSKQSKLHGSHLKARTLTLKDGSKVDVRAYDVTPAHIDAALFYAGAFSLGWKPYACIVHRALYAKLWTVSDTLTGTRIASAPTADHAVIDAALKLAAKGQASYHEAVSKIWRPLAIAA